VLDEEREEYLVLVLPGSVPLGDLPAHDGQRGQAVEQDAVGRPDEIRLLGEDGLEKAA